MAASRRTSLLVSMPAPLKRALAREVARRHGTMNDVAVSILAERFREPSSYPAYPRRARGRPTPLLRPPTPFKRAVARSVSLRNGTMNDVPVSILPERFRAPFEPSGRRGGATPGASGAVLLRVPPALKEALQDEASSTAGTTNQLVERFLDRKSTRLNSSHSQISYAVFCLKKKKTKKTTETNS